MNDGDSSERKWGRRTGAQTVTPEERAVLPPSCQWHSEEIEALKVSSDAQAKTVATLLTDVRIITERIPANIAVTLATVMGDVKRTMEDVAALRDTVAENYVKREEFQALRDRHGLIEKMVFGVVAVICLAVITALVYTVVTTKGGHL
jgi:hypothetical protein